MSGTRLWPKGARCEIDDCDRPRTQRAWCQRHYVAWKKHGDPLYRRPTLAERFTAMVDATGGEDACWPWTGLCQRYGIVRVGRTIKKAHRVAWELAYGPIPAGMHVLHHCDNPPCCNHRHLFLGTHADNMADMVGKGRGNTAAAIEAARLIDKRGEAHPQAKLTFVKVATIRVAAAGGESYASLGRRFDVSGSMISNIVNGRAWTNDGEAVVVLKGDA